MPVNTSRRLMIAVQLLLALAYAIPVLTGDRVTGSDFRIYYTGGAIVRDGRGSNLYDVDVQRTYQAQVVAQGGSGLRYELFPFINPPHAAFLLVPFTYLSPKTASIVFLGFDCLLAAWLLFRFWQISVGWSYLERTLLLTTILGTELFWYNFGLLTMTFFVCTCILEYYLALRAKRDTRAALWLIAATVKPQLLLLPALIPLALRRGRLILIALCFGFLIGFLVSLTLGFHIWLDYLRLLREVSTHGETYGAITTLMNNLRMILYWTVPPQAINPLVYLALFASVPGIFWLWRSSRAFDLRFALTVLLGLFLAPYLHYQDTLLAFLPAALSYGFARSERRNLIPIFQVLVLAVTFVPALLLITGHDRPLASIWPLPLIILLIAVTGIALRGTRNSEQNLRAHRNK
jgi:hypothetical protein